MVENCGVANETQTVTLPALSAEKYDIAPGATEGKSIFTLKEEPSISFEADSLAGVHVHSYSDWTVTEENMPTAEATGKATRTCSGGDGCDGLLELALPALTDSKYVITNNTATLTAAGTGTYTIELDGETVSFTAETPKYEPTLISISKTISIGTLTETVQGNLYDYQGMIIDATNGKVRPNNGNVQVNPGTKFVLAVADGAQITITWYNTEDKYGNDKNAEIVIENGIATITIKADPDGIAGASGIYMKAINVNIPLKVIEEELNYNYSGDISSTEYMSIIGCRDHNNGAYLYVPETTGSVQLNVKSGSVITIVSEYDAGAYVTTQGSDTPIDISGEAVGNTRTMTYTATEDGIITITAKSTQIYIKSIKVTPPTV